MVALELFAVRNGRDAVSLDELIPGCLPSVPIDPATGQPFRYTPIVSESEKPAFLLYSVGADGVDDGGHYLQLNPYLGRGSGWTGYDVPLNLPREELE